MNMELLSRITIGVILTANLSACEVVDILTFKAHPNSGVSTSTTTVELLSKQPLPKGQTRDQTADDDYGLCQSQSGPNIAPLLLPVISGIATLFVDSGTQAISAWADKKKKEFTTTLSVNANQEALLLKHPDGLHLAFDCVVVRQSSDKHVSRSATVQQPYLVFAGRLIVSNDKTAFRIVPTYLEFAKATAKTDATSGKVDVQIKLQFNTINSGKLAELGTATITFPAIELPAESATTIKHSLVTTPDDAVLLNRDSAWVPISSSDALTRQCVGDKDCASVSPISVVATLTEAGTGSDAFGKLSTDATSSTKTIESIITQTIQGLSPASPSTKKPATKP